MNRFAFIVLTLFLVSFIGYGQKGEIQKLNVGIGNRDHNQFEGDKNGFEFSGVELRYQFVNCGGDVQMGLQYSKNANFTSFYADGQRYYKSTVDEVAPGQWPAPSDIRIEELKADLYFGTIFLGKVHLNYIIGNSMGCFGETFDVLQQVGKDAESENFKKEIQSLRLTNIQIVRGDALGDRKNRILGALRKNKEAEANKAQAESYLRSGHVQYGIGDYKGAADLYQKAYNLNKDPQTLTLVENAKKALQEQTAATARQTVASSPPPASSNTAVLTQTSSSATRPTTGSGTATSKNNANTSSKSNSSSRASSDIYQKAENAGKTLAQMEYEKQAYQRQQREKLQQATNPGGYYLQQSGVNDYFNNQIDKINREAAAKEEREEREWLARKRREDREARKRQQAYEQNIKNNIARHEAGREQRMADYKAMGGDANYNNKLNQWRIFAAGEIKQINTFLTRYRGATLTFQFPENNCDYVTAIESIQNTTIPENYKDILINNVLVVRNEYYKFYIENAFTYNEWDVGYDALSVDVVQGTCAGYLQSIAKTTGFQSYGSFARGQEYVIGNKAYQRGSVFWEKGNYQIPLGAAPIPISFKEDVKNAGISIRNAHLNSLGNVESIWKKYSRKPYNWLEGIYYRTYSRGSAGYSDGFNYSSKILWGNTQAIQEAVDKYNDLYDLKLRFRLNKIADELQMAYFNYHTGNYQSGYEHLVRYALLVHGSIQNFAENSKKAPDNNELSTIEIPLLAAVLFMENGHYDLSFQFLDALKVLNVNNKKSYEGTPSSVNEAIEKLKNQIYYRQGAYSKMTLPKDEAMLKAEFKKIDELFDKTIPGGKRMMSVADQKVLQARSKEEYLTHKDYPLKASALIKLGNEKLAKKTFEKAYKHFLKKGYFSGSQTDIDAFKHVLATLYPSSQSKIKFTPITGYHITNYVLYTYMHGPSQDIYLAPNDLVMPGMPEYDYVNYLSVQLPENKISARYMLRNPLDLSNFNEWKKIESKLSTHDGSRQALTEIYEQLTRLYSNASLIPNDDSYNFLTAYIQMGVALSKFQETLPVIAEKQILFPEREAHLEEKLAMLMWSRNYLEDENIYQGKEFIRNLQPAKTFFDTAVKNNEEDKKILSIYLSIWSRYKFSSPMIPYLYGLYN